MRALRAADRVSASQLVRRFGHWQNVASERPVFVLHHGNPRWALISIPLLSNLADEADHDAGDARLAALHDIRSEEHTSELQSLMRISYAVFCLKNKKK